MNNKKISIITACRNAEKTIAKTIKSINNQSYKNIEHIIVDGNSTDQTWNIIKENKLFQGKIISEADSGANEAFNKALKFVTGEIVFFLLSDDFLANNNIIKKVVELFDSETYIVYGNIEYFDHKKNKLTGRKFIPGKFKKNSYYKGWHAPFTAFFMKKICFEKYGNFKNIEVSDDFEIMFRFQELNFLNSRYINETITYMGTGGRSANIINIIIGNYNVVKTLSRHNKKLFVPLFLYKRLFPKVLDKIKIFLKNI